MPPRCAIVTALLNFEIGSLSRSERAAALAWKLGRRRAISRCRPAWIKPAQHNDEVFMVAFWANPHSIHLVEVMITLSP